MTLNNVMGVQDFEDATRVALGRISGLYGVQGWVRIFSYTVPRAQVTKYNPWLLNVGNAWRSTRVIVGREHGRAIVAQLAGIDSRDAAAKLVGAEIAILRSQLPKLGEGEFYWVDLIGLRVQTQNGMVLGRVERMLDTGAHDVLVVRRGSREHLIPWLKARIIKTVDLKNGLLVVDWDVDF